MGLFGVSLSGTTVGPVIGGALAETLGWRSVFWFLTVLASIVFIFVLFLLPETLRSIVGNGSVRSNKLWHLTLFDIRRSREENTGTVEVPRQQNRLWDPFKIILDKDTALSLFISSLVYAMYSIGMFLVNITDLHSSNINSHLIFISLRPPRIGDWLDIRRIRNRYHPWISSMGKSPRLGLGKSNSTIREKFVWRFIRFSSRIRSNSIYLVSSSYILAFQCCIWMDPSISSPHARRLVISNGDGSRSYGSYDSMENACRGRIS
jgi:MFS family permease